MIKVFPSLMRTQERCPDHPTETPEQGKSFTALAAGTDNLLDLLGQGLLFFLPSPAVLFVPVAGFLFHQPALRYPARLSFEALVSTRVAHGACRSFLARRFQCLSDKYIPQGSGKLNVSALLLPLFFLLRHGR